MIQANELRIGNWVQHEPYPDEKWCLDFKLLESIDLQLIEVIGIPLTPEILAKCGFDIEIRPMLGAVSLVNLCHKTMGRDGTIVLNLPINYRFKTNDIKYLNQLQNLYFALTGEELKYTP